MSSSILRKRGASYSRTTESLEQRVAMSACYSRGNLEFFLNDPSLTTWNGASTTGDVQVGLLPPTTVPVTPFAALLDVPKGLSITNSGNTDIIATNGAITTALAKDVTKTTVETLFGGATNFNLDVSAGTTAKAPTAGPR